MGSEMSSLLHWKLLHRMNIPSAWAYKMWVRQSQQQMSVSLSMCVCVTVCAACKSDYVSEARSVRELLSREIKCNIILSVMPLAIDFVHKPHRHPTPPPPHPHARPFGSKCHILPNRPQCRRNQNIYMHTYLHVPCSRVMEKVCVCVCVCGWTGKGRNVSETANGNRTGNCIHGRHLDKLKRVIKCSSFYL